MAKTNLKRKVEDAHRVSKTAGRQINQFFPYSKAPEDESVEEGEDKDKGMFVKQPLVQPSHFIKRTTALKSKPVRFVSQYEEDQGKTDSQQFMDLVRFGSKKQAAPKRVNKYLEDFKHTVKGQACIAKDLGVSTSQRFNREAEFLEEFHKAHHAIMFDGLARVEKYTDRSHTMKDASKSVVGDAYQLLAEFHNSSCELASHKSSTLILEQGWFQGISDLERILEIGKCVGETKIASVLSGSMSPEIRPDYVMASDTLFGNAKESAEGMTWADMARIQEMSIRRLIATLHLD